MGFFFNFDVGLIRHIAGDVNDAKAEAEVKPKYYIEIMH